MSPAHDHNRLLDMDRATLYAHAVHSFRRGGGTEPDVVIVACGQARAVLKDYGRADGWFARLIGPLLIHREAQALRRLAGVTGVPRMLRRLDARAVLMEYVPAEPWPRMQPPAVAFDRLDALVANMHTRGVAHCDLRAPSNILVDESGRPFLVDFVARVCRGRPWNLPWNWIFRRFCQADRNALAKLKVRHAPELATEQDRYLATHRGIWVKGVRRAGDVIRRSFRALVPGAR